MVQFTGPGASHEGISQSGRWTQIIFHISFDISHSSIWKSYWLKSSKQ